MDARIPPGFSGRIPLAVVVVDAAGRVSHWSTGARRLFGPSRFEAVGRPAADLLPVVGALESAAPRDPAPGSGAAYPPEGADGPGLDDPLDGGGPYPTAGRA
ncbi:MAG: PAS domain-containing protein, partial [Streptomyces sp.]|nr:PAS domain-containing protein [Streptomyces sp.]